MIKFLEFLEFIFASVAVICFTIGGIATAIDGDIEKAALHIIILALLLANYMKDRKHKKEIYGYQNPYGII